MPAKVALKHKNRVAAIRAVLEFTPAEMADLLGVNVATLYRWESGSVERMDPLQKKILEYIQYRIDNTKMWHGPVPEWAHDVRKHLRLGGTLRGLAALLYPLLDHA